jgi:dTDP-4-dehydrorhamnose reductase
MKILLFGADGQVGWELRRSLAPLGEVVALTRQGGDAAALGLCGDLADLRGIAATVGRVRPDVVVNAAAYTAVDHAESEPALADLINAQAPGVLAQAAEAVGAWMVHYSSDYVFDGSGTSPWRESDPTGPLSVYGRTKLAGEQAVARLADRHLVFRTSWVYAARGQNFLRTILRLACERDQLRVVADQVGAPTGADLIADVTAHALRAVGADPRLGGLYHLAAAGETSWHGYACMALARARALGAPLRVDPAQIEPIATEAFPTAAQRPRNSRLSARQLQERLGLALPDWQVGVARAVAEIITPPAF